MRIHKTLYAKAVLTTLVVALLVTFFYPSGQANFKYHYSVNQPWRYDEVLIAPFDFTVRKSADLIQAEKNNIEQTKTRYYNYHPEVYIQQKNKLMDNYNKGRLPEKIKSHSKTFAHLLKTLEEIYSHGILPKEDRVMLTDTASIYLIGKDNIAKKRGLDELYSPQQAYDLLKKKLNAEIDSTTLLKTQITSYIIPNLKLDNDRTEQVVLARMASIDEAVGTVYKGEKIIAQGEIITPEIFQKIEGYKQAFEKRAISGKERFRQRVGIFLLIAFIIGSLMLFLLSFRSRYLTSRKDQCLILGMVIFFPALTYLLVPVIPMAVYMIPYAMVPILVRIFLDSRTAFYTFLVSLLLSALIVPDALEFLTINFLTGLTAIITLRKLTQRSDLIRSTFFVFIVLVCSYFSFTVATKTEFSDIDYWRIFYFAVNFLFLMFSYAMVYLFECILGYTSDISMIELSDINKPLLRKLSEVAPGTFQHSLNVSILSSAAVAKIGGDVQLVRSGALYHDIGKMKNPAYFTENQNGGFNPHSKLTHDESARVIIRHVTDGVEMAQKAKLPPAIIDFIRTHHGLGMTKYFYIQYKNEHPNQEDIDETIFHYPGPNPFTKEQGILMLADAVEASSRSLTEFTDDTLQTHINKIINAIIDAGLLKNTPLTFLDIEITKQIFLEKLRTMNHSRIKYPELNKEENSATTSPSTTS